MNPDSIATYIIVFLSGLLVGISGMSMIYVKDVSYYMKIIREFHSERIEKVMQELDEARRRKS